VDTPIGQFLLIGNFRRRLARELLVFMVKVNSVRAQGSQGSVRPCSFFREWLNDEVGEGMVGTGALIGHMFLRDQSRL